jgi:hypothetical protein
MITASTNSLELSITGNNTFRTVFTAPYNCIVFARTLNSLPLGSNLLCSRLNSGSTDVLIFGNNLEHNNVFLLSGESIIEQFFNGSYELFIIRIG